MIGLMGLVIFYCLREMWHSSATFPAGGCLVGMGLAVIVIVLKVQALRTAKGRNEESPRSKV